jgi:bifunctional NMN adenylyltransferase/nudix hydrolase
MNKEFDLLVFVGRFSPFHNEHKRVIDIALEKSKNVLVLIGSSGKARTIRNPFTFDERKEMIRSSFDSSVCPRGAAEGDGPLIIKPLYDKTYNDAAWIKQVQDVVKDTTLEVINTGGFIASGYNDAKVGLIGASKDGTSYYLKLFPQWNSVNVAIEADVHATAIRESFYEDEIVYSDAPLPGNVINWMNEFTLTDECEAIRREYWFVKSYKEQWAVSPYPVKHATVDCVVEQSGHVLLVKRRSEPGKGLWALPGGHLNEFETQLDGAIRELREETKIKVPEAVLRGNIVANRTFDDPYRSTIGRVITQAYHIKLPDATELPKVKGSDDAEKAKWIPISDLREDQMFDDHFHLIQYFLGL